MQSGKRRLTLDRPTVYQIVVPGYLDEDWAEWVGELAVTAAMDEDGLPVTNLTGIVDQAALIGLLRRLNSLGLPLISVICLEVLID
jgi:hypothetical protein